MRRAKLFTSAILTNIIKYAQFYFQKLDTQDLNRLGKFSKRFIEQTTTLKILPNRFVHNLKKKMAPATNSNTHLHVKIVEHSALNF